MTNIKIGDFEIKKGRAMLIAELSANHGGSFDIALKTLEAAKEAGADAVKLQTYTADTLTIKCSRSEFTLSNGSIWDGSTYYDLYSSAYTPWHWQPKLKEAADKMGLILFSSPFDFTAVDFLEKMDVPAYKIASFEIVDIPLIKYTASKGKPIIISTGIAEDKDVKKAVDACHAVGNHQIILLKCTSSYPAPLNEANLKAIPYLEKTFGVPSGLSDHTEGNIAAVASVVLGGVIIEKHFILNKNISSADASFSVTPQEFKNMVEAVRMAESALGENCLTLTASQKRGRAFARSLYAVEAIKKGEAFTEKNIRSIRPSGGLHPEYYEKILGKKAVKDIERGEPLKLSMFEDENI